MRKSVEMEDEIELSKFHSCPKSEIEEDTQLRIAVCT